MDHVNSLFTTESLLSFQGATVAAWLVPNALGRLFGNQVVRYRAWIAFVVAMGLALIIAYIATESSVLKWVVAFFNGLIIFMAALGANESGSGGGGARGGAERPASVRRF